MFSNIDGCWLIYVEQIQYSEVSLKAVSLNSFQYWWLVINGKEFFVQYKMYWMSSILTSESLIFSSLFFICFGAKLCCGVLQKLWEHLYWISIFPSTSASAATPHNLMRPFFTFSKFKPSDVCYLPLKANLHIFYRNWVRLINVVNISQEKWGLNPD